MKKALHLHMETGPLCMHTIGMLGIEFFKRKDYEWWVKVQPGDVCVDIGACNGMFTALALDSGASKVYSLEPNREIMQALITNMYDYIVDQTERRVIPVNYAIGSNPSHVGNVFLTDDFKVMSFKDFIKKYDIQHIDYLKLDCEGGEYDVLTEENYDFISKNVKHIAVEIHLRSSKDAPQKFIEMRDTFIDRWKSEGNRVTFMNPSLDKAIYNDELILKTPGEFMMYMTKK